MRTLRELLFGKEIENRQMSYEEAIARARELQEQGAYIEALRIGQFGAKDISKRNSDYETTLDIINCILAPYDHGDGLKGDTKVQYNCNRFNDYETHRLDFTLIFDNLFKKGLKQKGRLKIVKPTQGEQ